MSKSNNAQMHNFTAHSTQIPYRSLSNLGLVVAVISFSIHAMDDIMDVNGWIHVQAT